MIAYLSRLKLAPERDAGSMIIWLRTVHEDAQAASLVLKEGLGLVDREAGAGAHDPLPPRPLRRGVVSVAGRRHKSGPQRAEDSVKMQKRC
jgi:hypothetical protein